MTKQELEKLVKYNTETIVKTVLILEQTVNMLSFHFDSRNLEEIKQAIKDLKITR